MKKLTLILLTLAWFPVALAAVPEMPANTAWYLHADLETMRDGAAGRELYRWLDTEAFAEVKEETGIDVSKELQRLTAYSAVDTGLSVVFEGPISEDLRNRVLAVMTLRSDPDLREHEGKDYYHALNEEASASDDGPLGGISHSAFVSFAVPGRVLVTSQEQQMHKLLGQNGRIAVQGKRDGALLVLTADRTLLQAGVRPDAITDKGDDWDSSILRNAEQLALLLADQDGLLAIEARLKSRDPRLTESLGSVISGIISLQAFNDDLDPDIRGLIVNTKVSAMDAWLNVNTVLDPADVLRLLRD